MRKRINFILFKMRETKEDEKKKEIQCPFQFNKI